MILYGPLAGTSSSTIRNTSRIPSAEIQKSLHPFDLQKNQGGFRGMSSFNNRDFAQDNLEGKFLEIMVRYDKNYLWLAESLSPGRVIEPTLFIAPHKI